MFENVYSYLLAVRKRVVVEEIIFAQTSGTNVCKTQVSCVILVNVREIGPLEMYYGFILYQVNLYYVTKLQRFNTIEQEYNNMNTVFLNHLILLYYLC